MSDGKYTLLVLGSGGREHALCWRIAHEGHRAICAPGSQGIAQHAQVEGVALSDIAGIIELAKREKVDAVIVGPEQPLVDGVADALREAGVPVVGPSAAAAELEGDCLVLSLLGIDSSLEHEGVHQRAHVWRASTGLWSALEDAPGLPRLAASAVSLGGQVYLLGGYTVEANGTEVSQSELWLFEPDSQRWRALADAPVPIDDTVLVPYAERYLIAISGWSNTGNVRAVQIYDAEEDQWHMAEDFPGTPAFGHSAAISGNTLVLIDGVRSGALGFDLTKQAWQAELSEDEPPVLTWTELPEHPGPARYRAAAGLGPDGLLWFHGGTAEPYNFDGLRYDNGQPAVPLASTLRVDPATGGYDEALEAKPTASMDHRGLPGCGGRVFVVGGLEEGPAASSALWSFAP